MKNLKKSLLAWIKRLYRRFERKINLSKREQFVFITVLATVGLLVMQMLPLEWRYVLVILLAGLTYLATAFALREDLQGIEWFTLLLPVTLYTLAVALFYFLLPNRWLFRLPVVLSYAVGFYAQLLTANIYNVAVNRTIGLLRAAHTVGFIISLVTYFLLVQTIFAYRAFPWVNLLGVGGISLLLFLPLFWVLEFSEKISTRLWQFVLVLTLIQLEFAWILSFYPIVTTLKALLLTTSFYVQAGITQEYLQNRLYKRDFYEFIFVLLSMIFVVSLTTHWRGYF